MGIISFGAFQLLLAFVGFLGVHYNNIQGVVFYVIFSSIIGLALFSFAIICTAVALGYVEFIHYSWDAIKTVRKLTD